MTTCPNLYIINQSETITKHKTSNETADVKGNIQKYQTLVLADRYYKCNK